MSFWERRIGRNTGLVRRRDRLWVRWVTGERKALRASRRGKRKRERAQTKCLRSELSHVWGSSESDNQWNCTGFELFLTCAPLVILVCSTNPGVRWVLDLVLVSRCCCCRCRTVPTSPFLRCGCHCSPRRDGGHCIAVTVKPPKP